jgi:hypothetical protein
MTKPTKLAAVSGDTNAAVLSERMRVSAILESAEGKRNPAMAQELALRSSLDAETARSILGKAPAANPYLEAMNQQGPINLGEGIGANVATFDSADNAKAARLKEIEVSVGAFNVSKGYAPKKSN